MTTLVRIAIALFLALFATSCGFDMKFGPGESGNGNIVEDLREIESEFDAVEASEGITVFITQAPEYSVRVEADENIIDNIGTRVRNGELQVYATESIGKATKNVYVHMPKITSLEVNSGADLISESPIESATLAVAGSSGGMLKVAINAQDTEVDASSGANLDLSGTTGRLDVDASSGANIRARDLQSSVCKASASSGANISVYAEDELTAGANSGANIRYRGDAVVHKKKSFSGNVSKD